MPLLKSHITKIELNTDEWKMERLAKFTASRISCLMTPKGIGEGGLNYIRTRVFEELSGETTEKDIITEAIVWGIQQEKNAIGAFCDLMGVAKEDARIQVLIHEQKSKFSCTPDVIIPLSETPDKLAYHVTGAEVKCFQAENHVEMCECDNPIDLKKANPSVYWQTLFQMDLCGALKWFAVFYNPLLKVSSLKVIEFNKTWSIQENGKPKYPLIEDFKLMADRKKEALEHFDRIRNKLLGI